MSPPVRGHARWCVVPTVPDHRRRRGQRSQTGALGMRVDDIVWLSRRTVRSPRCEIEGSTRHFERSTPRRGPTSRRTRAAARRRGHGCVPSVPADSRSNGPQPARGSVRPRRGQSGAADAPPRRASGRPRAGRSLRFGQGGGTLRPRSRVRHLNLCVPHGDGRTTALLPRRGMGAARPPPRQGAVPEDHRRDRSAQPRARPSSQHQRARGCDRRDGGAVARGDG